MSKTLENDTILNGRYRIKKILGQGGMSNVYLVQDEKLDNEWALKEMLDVFPEMEKAEFLDQFKKEARILAGIKHPNLPRVFDYFEEHNRHYLVMEFIKGQTLSDIMEKSPSVSTERVLDWAVQICDVLHSLHGEGIIYRDLKPDNVLVNQDNHIFIVDFGIARLFRGGKIKDTIIIGTPGFASPEQHGQAQTDARSDVYSLGATMHYLLTGVDPGIMPFVFKPPAELKPEIPAELSDIIMKALSMDPAGRFQTMAEMRKHLEHFLKKPPKTTRKLDTPESSRKIYEQSIPAPKISSTDGAVRRKTAFGGETFTLDPVKTHIYPAIYSGGVVSAATVIITGGIITAPIAFMSMLTMLPAVYLMRQLLDFVKKSPEKITLKISSVGIEIVRGNLTMEVPWEEVRGFLSFNEKTAIGTKVRKYKIFTTAGNFEYTREMRHVERLNDLIITRGGLVIAGESEDYRRYSKPDEGNKPQ